MSEYVEDDRIPIQEIINKITPQDLVKAESKKTVDFKPVHEITKPPDIGSKILMKRLTF
jgi:hypothetical protein